MIGIKLLPSDNIFLLNAYQQAEASGIFYLMPTHMAPQGLVQNTLLYGYIIYIIISEFKFIFLYKYWAYVTHIKNKHRPNFLNVLEDSFTSLFISPACSTDKHIHYPLPLGGAQNQKMYHPGLFSSLLHLFTTPAIPFVLFVESLHRLLVFCFS